MNTSKTGKSDIYPFEEVGRLPAASDNVAIAGRKLAAGARISYEGRHFLLDYTVLEGHRFAVRPIDPGEALLSWGLPFGIATRSIVPGNYVCNEAMIEALQERRIDFVIPPSPNFRDQILPYALDERTFRPGEQVAPYRETRHFMGYRRTLMRGVGTRNMIVILGTTSRTAGFARLLERRLQGAADDWPHVDGIVAISHTEGSGDAPLNNQTLLLRTLAGLVVHPNVGAVLAVDAGPDQVTNALLQQFLTDEDYPLEDVLHCFYTLSGDFQADLAAGERVIREWLPVANQTPRTSQPLSSLKLALQCGGSDAFSGISGNPLAAAVAREIVRYGGSANLGETDELIGAEAYVLQNVRDLETAQRFLEVVARFKERLAWHGVTAEGNPSGGNRYRGLYNVVLKSIGAAMKRNPNVRLDYVVDYAVRMEQPGFYFMDTPGNDLESIAGQVAGGSNMIVFVTGNGSITNFPLAPTIKIMTTSDRYAMLAAEMDVNAGAYQDGRAMDDLARETLDLMVAVASGQKSAGEKAGHAQVSIWRNWQQTSRNQVSRLLSLPRPDGRPIPIQSGDPIPGDYRFRAMKVNGRTAADQVGLILPTSLCSGQIARLSADRLNQAGFGRPHLLSRFVSLTHTEGCGVAALHTHDLFDQTILGYAVHPLVRFTLFLEHGCEKTHNDHMRRQLQQRGLDRDQFGWASIQLDGGIAQVMDRITAWFQEALSAATTPTEEMAGLEHLSIGLLTAGPLSEAAARALTQITRTIVDAGGTVVVPQSAALLEAAPFRQEALLTAPTSPSLAYGQPFDLPGFHVMETPSSHWVETLTGLGATGVQLMLAYVDGRPLQAHPLVPLVQVTASGDGQQPAADFDLVLHGNSQGWAGQTLALLMQVASRVVTPRTVGLGNVDFQITRGLLGIST